MTKKETGEKRIGDIIDAAVLEFIEKGYDAASMESIAARAGLTKGGLYYYFSGKDDILIAANNAFMEPIRGLMKKVSGMKKPLDALRYYISNYILHWAAHQREIVFTFLSLAKILTRTDMWPFMEAYVNEMLSFYQSLFERAVENGDLRAHDTRARAISLMTSLEGMIGYVAMCKSLGAKEAVVMIERVFIDDIKLTN